ncbi:MAG: protein kinase [Parachlamydiaceae bacterium]
MKQQNLINKNGFIMNINKINHTTNPSTSDGHSCSNSPRPSTSVDHRITNASQSLHGGEPSATTPLGQIREISTDRPPDGMLASELEKIVRDTFQQHTTANDTGRINRQALLMALRDKIMQAASKPLHQPMAIDADTDPMFQKFKLTSPKEKISVLFRVGVNGNIIDAYLKGVNVGEGGFKNVRELHSLLQEETVALAASKVAFLKKEKSDSTSSSVESTPRNVSPKFDNRRADANRNKIFSDDLLLEENNINKLRIAMEKESNTAGLPPPAGLITWYNAKGVKRTAMITKLAEFDGKTFLEEDFSSATTLQRIQCVKDIANILSLMHKHKFLHLDVKPSNILIDKNSEGKIKAYLIDYAGMQSSDTTKGSVHTESYTNKSASLPHQDVHAFAMTAFELLTGKTMELAALQVTISAVKKDIRELIAQKLKNTPENSQVLAALKLKKKTLKSQLKNKINSDMEKLKLAYSKNESQIIYKSLTKMISIKGNKKESSLGIKGFLNILNKLYPPITHSDETTC